MYFGCAVRFLCMLMYFEVFLDFDVLVRRFLTLNMHPGQEQLKKASGISMGLWCFWYPYCIGTPLI